MLSNQPLHGCLWLCHAKKGPQTAVSPLLGLITEAYCVRAAVCLVSRVSPYPLRYSYYVTAVMWRAGAGLRGYILSAYVSTTRILGWLMCGVVIYTCRFV